jgi:arylsulfatase A-like enzyme
MSGKHQMYEHTIRVPFFIAGPGVGGGVGGMARHLPDVVAMVDIAPTLLELAGVALPRGAHAMMDGRSFAPTLLDAAPTPRAPRTTHMMVEFYSLSNGSPNTPPCAAANAAAAAANASTPPRQQCYDLHASHSDWSNNTFIGLRIVTASHDLAYAEYTQVADMYHFAHVYFRELYDLRADPYQLRNIYPQQSQAQRAALHRALAKEFRCRGATCASWSTPPLQH